MLAIRKLLPFAALVAAAVALPLQAQETSVELDPAETHIAFTLGSTLHTVHGVFQLRRGKVGWDAATGKASGELIVDAASGTSGNASRDQRMHRQVLESRKYPDIVFRLDRIEGSIPTQGHTVLRVHGVFSIHGSDHEITVPTQLQVEPNQISATLLFSIPYVQWGLKNPSNFLLRVSDKADIEIRTVLHVQQPGI